jgi:hypothetical protein
MTVEIDIEDISGLEQRLARIEARQEMIAAVLGRGPEGLGAALSGELLQFSDIWCQSCRLPFPTPKVTVLEDGRLVIKFVIGGTKLSDKKTAEYRNSYTTMCEYWLKDSYVARLTPLKLCVDVVDVVSFKL